MTTATTRKRTAAKRTGTGNPLSYPCWDDLPSVSPARDLGAYVSPPVLDEAACAAACAAFETAYGAARAEIHADFDRVHYALVGGTPSWEAPDTFAGCGDEATPAAVTPGLRLIAAITEAANTRIIFSPTVTLIPPGVPFGELDPADEARLARINDAHDELDAQKTITHGPAAAPETDRDGWRLLDRHRRPDTAPGFPAVREWPAEEGTTSVPGPDTPPAGPGAPGQDDAAEARDCDG